MVQLHAVHFGIKTTIHVSGSTWMSYIRPAPTWLEKRFDSFLGALLVFHKHDSPIYGEDVERLLNEYKIFTTKGYFYLLAQGDEEAAWIALKYAKVSKSHLTDIQLTDEKNQKIFPEQLGEI